MYYIYIYNCDINYIVDTMYIILSPSTYIITILL